LLENPIDLNAATAQDLEMLYLLSPAEIESILHYREHYGPFIHSHELQVVSDLSMEKVQSLLPLVTVQVDEDAMAEGQGYVFARSAGYLPKRKGFRSENGQPAQFESGPLSLLIKFRHYRSRKYSWGGSMELDAGERFTFQGRPGFDHLHGHY